MNKERIKGIAIGFALCLFLSASVMVVNAQTATRNVTYGVRVNLNGHLMDFDADSRPFVSGGRTFLPLRALAETLGLPVDFDRGSNTVYLGDRDLGWRPPENLRTAAPFFEQESTVGGNARVTFVDTINLGGVEYRDALRFSTVWGGRVFSVHNLQGDFRFLTGYVGREDGAGRYNITFNFIGDGELLQSIMVNADDMPIPFEVFVEGVTQLRIEAVFGGTRSVYAMQAFLE